MELRSGLAPASRVVPVITTGAATAFKLLVATLAFTGAYYGVASSHGAATGGQTTGRAGATAHDRTADTVIRTVVLSSRSMPFEATRVPQAGVVTVGISGIGSSCEQTYHAESVIRPTSSGDAVLYSWRLLRWSPTAQQWNTRMYSGTAGFIGQQRTVDWSPRVAGGPGLYRVELTMSGKGKIVSDRFQLSC